MPRSTRDADRSHDLRSAIERTGYYPDVVADGVFAAVAGEPVESYLVHHEPTFDRDEVRRHVTVLVLTPTRLIVAHTDEHAADDLLPEPYTSTTTEAVTLLVHPDRRGHPHGRQPDRRASRPPAEAVLTIGWGGVSRIDLEPAACSDPECDADHGYTGMLGRRRLLPAGVGRRRGPRRRRRAARLRRGALGPHARMSAPR